MNILFSTHKNMRIQFNIIILVVVIICILIHTMNRIRNYSAQRNPAEHDVQRNEHNVQQNFAEHSETCGPDVWTDKRVCVIGNGPSTLKKSLGQTIDACDVVIRLNDFETKSYTKQLGTKTDLWFCGMGVQQKHRQQPPASKIVVWSHVNTVPLSNLVTKKVGDVRNF